MSRVITQQKTYGYKDASVRLNARTRNVDESHQYTYEGHPQVDKAQDFGNEIPLRDEQIVRL